MLAAAAIAQKHLDTTAHTDTSVVLCVGMCVCVCVGQCCSTIPTQNVCVCGVGWGCADGSMHLTHICRPNYVMTTVRARGVCHHTVSALY